MGLINLFGTAVKTILSQLFLSVAVITQCLFQFQKLDYSGLLVSALHPTAIFPPPTIPTDSLFNFILNNRYHDQIHHHLSLPVSTELMNKKLIHTWQKKAINPLSSKVTYVHMFSLLHTGHNSFTEKIAKILQKHSSSPYHRFPSSLLTLLVLKSFCLSLFHPSFFRNKV